ncbi:DDE superfamily endonuclease [Popillia japonica]|uniref:DDE superfamily endonuclease n=1 Tax=Popillia japonica TaxID=7064 RepID=A0AAW1LPQ7_POPJA
MDDALVHKIPSSYATNAISEENVFSNSKDATCALRPFRYQRLFLEICGSRQVLTEHLRSHENNSQLQLTTDDETQNILTHPEKSYAYDTDGRNLDIEPPFVQEKPIQSERMLLNCKISDSNNKIIGCNARYPGSVHDSAIWQMSDIRNYLRQQYTNGDSNSHLLGDCGYQLEPWLFTSFNNPDEGSPEERFNEQFIRARNVIERTNGI